MMPHDWLREFTDHPVVRIAMWIAAATLCLALVVSATTGDPLGSWDLRSWIRMAIPGTILAGIAAWIWVWR
jgi:hypothetical protein